MLCPVVMYLLLVSRPCNPPRSSRFISIWASDPSAPGMPPQFVLWTLSPVDQWWVSVCDESNAVGPIEVTGVPLPQSLESPVCHRTPDSIHTIVVGIKDYPGISDSPPLRFACNAIKFRNALIEIGAKTHNITLLLDAAATKRAIIDRIDSLTDSDARVKRGDNDAIGLFLRRLCYQD